MNPFTSRRFAVCSLIFAALLALGVAPTQAQSYLHQSSDGNDAAMTGFGSNVAVGAEAVFVTQAENQYGPGLVYVYRENAEGAWTEVAQLESPDAVMGDHFGASIAVGNGTLLVSATPPQEDAPGSVYVFNETADGTWETVGQFSAADAGAQARFGVELALRRDVAFVTAASDSARGAVYVFKRMADGTWEQQAKLQGSAVEAKAGFGASLALGNGVALIGAPGQNEGNGAVYVFEQGADGTWTETAMLTSDVAENEGNFGAAVALRGDHALIGAPRTETGVVVRFERNDEGRWEEANLLLPFESSRRAFFGMAVEFTDQGAWVGSPGAARFAGRVYRFQRSEEGTWTGSMKIAAEGLETRDFYGMALAVQGDVGVVGIRGGAGGAIIYEREGGEWQQQTLVRGEVDALPAVSGERVRCQEGEAGLYECKNVNMMSFTPIHALGGDPGTELNDIWGWTDPQTGIEYALVGRTDGTAFVNISDPMNPVYVGELPMTPTAHESSWRDIKTYENHAFIVSDGAGEHGMQVFDLTKLRQYEGEPITFEPELVYDNVASAHNIFINDSTGFAYIVGAQGGGTTCGGGLHMVNIQDPTNPTFAGCFADESTGRRGTGYSHDVQCVVYHGPDEDYKGREICFGSNETALSIADVTDKDNPVAISATPYPGVAYAHQGWLTEDHRYFFMNDELDEQSGNTEQTRTLIWDVSNLDDPQLIKEYTYGTVSIDHNLYITDGKMYQSNYTSGLRIHDVSDPTNPEQIGYFDTTPTGGRQTIFAGTWSNYPFYESDVIAVSSIGEGLFLLNYAPPQEPAL